eukprot:scaffold35520_cov112-Isochrysis_galbana.AAC.1
MKLHAAMTNNHSSSAGVKLRLLVCVVYPAGHGEWTDAHSPPCSSRRRGWRLCRLPPPARGRQ